MGWYYIYVIYIVLSISDPFYIVYGGGIQRATVATSGLKIKNIYKKEMEIRYLIFFLEGHYFLDIQ